MAMLKQSDINNLKKINSLYGDAQMVGTIEALIKVDEKFSNIADDMEAFYEKKNKLNMYLAAIALINTLTLTIAIMDMSKIAIGASTMLSAIVLLRIGRCFDDSR